METLILEIGTRGLHRYAGIEGETTTVGRGLDNDIILSDPTVAAHHLEIKRGADGSLEIVNLTDINPVRFSQSELDLLAQNGEPVLMQIGRVQARLMRRDTPVAEIRPLAGNGRSGHLFGSILWSALLFLACLVYGGLEFYLDSYTSINASDVFKYVLRESLLTLSAFVIALSILERLLVNRWEIKQLITSVCLVYLLYKLLNILSAGLVYLVSAAWPSLLLLFSWYLLILPATIALYLIHISHLRTGKSLLLAILIAGPIALPSLLQNRDLKAMIDDFSSAARYQNSLSSLNWHLKSRVDINEFINQARKLDQGEFAN